MSIHGLFQGNKFFSKKPSNKKTLASSFTQLNKGNQDIQDIPFSKNKIFVSGQIDKSIQTPQKRDFAKKQHNSSKFRTQQDQDYLSRDAHFATDTSVIDRGLGKSKSSSNKKDKFESNLRGEQKKQANSLVEELYAEADTQLLRVNELIESFNRKISKQIKQEFKKFKEVIINTLDKIFSESSESFKKIIQKQQAKCLSQIQSAKSSLESLYFNLEKMKDDTKSSRKKIEQEVKQNNFEGQLNQIIDIIEEFEKEEPKINIFIDKRRIDNYNEALIGLLELQDDNPRHKRNN